MRLARDCTALLIVEIPGDLTVHTDRDGPSAGLCSLGM